MLRAGLIYGSGDLLASLISGGFSPARAIGMTLIGGLLYAPEIHTWFGWLAKRYPEPASPGQRWQRAALAWCSRVRQLRSQVFVFSRANFQKCHYNSANCSGAAGFSIPNA